ncbi:MAG: glutamate 5-kinase [Spirochaetaceae bacterium]|jgi:glutamate 5-kinase|nr:glutamate 5-kinase [Spirochaetaceae bacterium]
MTIAGTIAAARKIVVKIGSATLAKPDGTINIAFMRDFAAQCAAMSRAGKQFALVSSGAQVAGISKIDRWTRKTDMNYRQALCAIGQVELMNEWSGAFREHGLHIGQLLFTKEDFDDSRRSLNMRNTLFTLVDEGVIPVINENDSVACDEIRIGDNDNLSALTTILWNADALILFSDIDGIYTDNPKTNPAAKLIETVDSIAALRERITMGGVNGFGTGGIATKIEAAEKVCAYGIPLILANGSHDKALASLASGTLRGTLFLAEN